MLGETVVAEEQAPHTEHHQLARTKLPLGVANDKSPVIAMAKINRMSMMFTTSERLLEAVQTLPEPLQAEVPDFADFWRTRHTDAASQPAKITLASLCGGLENTKTFTESPLAIQHKLRDAWR